VFVAASLFHAIQIFAGKARA
jgi:hypothetical protein